MCRWHRLRAVDLNRIHRLDDTAVDGAVKMRAPYIAVTRFTEISCTPDWQSRTNYGTRGALKSVG
jgi:hypothetical protein